MSRAIQTRLIIIWGVARGRGLETRSQKPNPLSPLMKKDT